MTSLNETLQSIKEGNIAPVYLLYGTEHYFIELFKQTLIDELRSKIGEEITTYDLTEISIQDVIIDVETIPFFSEHKLLFLSDPVFLKTKPDSLPFSHDIDKLMNYLENPAPYSTVVFIAPYEKLDARKKASKALKKRATMIECQPIRDNDLRKWILYMAKQRKIEVTEEALFLLESEFENNLYLLQQEMDKLALYAGEDRQITKDIASEVVSASLRFSALELVDAVLKKDIHSAIKIYKDLEKRKEDPIGLIALLAYQFRVIFQVKLYRKKGYPNQRIQQEIMVHPYVVKLASERSKLFSQEKLTRIINELANTDAAIKRGKMDKGIAFELLLYDIIQT